MIRTERLIARANGTEKAALHNLARFERIKPSEAIRLAIREATRRRGCWPGPSIQEKGSEK